MSAYETLLCAVSHTQSIGSSTITVSTLDLAELLAELAALRGAGKTPASAYPPEFEEAWAFYPKRPGASKAATLKAWKARIKAGTQPLAMIEGAQAYASYCQAKGTEPEYIKQPATFFGPGEHFAADWKLPPAGAALAGRRNGPMPPLADQQRAANIEAKRRLGILDDMAVAAGFIDIDELRTIDATI